MTIDDHDLDDRLGILNAEEKAGIDLLDLVSLRDAPKFSLMVTCSKGHFVVRLDTPDGAGPGIGEGASFAEAWHRIDPWWVRGSNDP